MSRWGGVRWRRVLLVAFALIVINVPYGLHEWSLHRAATDGIQVTATVVGVTDAGDDSVVAYRLPSQVDDKREVRTVKVDRAVGQEARRTHELDMQVLEGHPDVVHVEGQVRGWGGLILTGFADALVVLMVLLMGRLGGRLRRPTLVGVAVEDVRIGDPGSLLDKQDDGTYVINGEVARTAPSSLVLTLQDREVEIHLRDHDNPIAVGGRARVRAELVG